MNGSRIRAASKRHIQRSLCHYGTLSLLWMGCFAPVVALSQESRQSAPVTILRPLLQSGSRGAEVTELQAVLKLLGYYEGSVSGFYGDTTIAAVSRFQQAAGLTKDGIVGTATWDRLFPPPISEPASTPFPATSTQPKPTAPSTSDFPTLRMGTQGTAVTRLQERLKAIGVFGGAIDGVFGAETQSAVRAVQSKFGLEPDGIVGGATWSALMQ